MASVLLVILSNLLETKLPDELLSRSTCHIDTLSISTCIFVNSTSPDGSFEHPQDMTNVMLVYMCLVAAVFLYMAFKFNPLYKRSDTDHNSEIHYKALKPVECFHPAHPISSAESQKEVHSFSDDALKTTETTYQSADLYSSYLITEESND